MNAADQAAATQLANIEKKTGRTIAELIAMVKSSGLVKHGEIRDMLKAQLGLGHGDANAVAHHALKPAEESGADPLDAIYSGAKAALRPIHEALMAAIAKLGPFEIAPKKANVSLRRKKQFALLGPATNTRFEIGLNMKGVPGTDRLLEQPPGGMCQYKVKLTSVSEVDADLIGWVKLAYDAAG